MSTIALPPGLLAFPPTMAELPWRDHLPADSHFHRPQALILQV